MRMRFNVEVAGDEEEALAVCDELVASFERWLGGHPDHPDAEAWDAGLLLAWKWGFGDGDYGLWTRADVDEVLLDHLPARLAAMADDAASIPPSLAAFVRFLDDEGLLDAGSDPVDVVASRALAQQRAFLDAMDDPANAGMAKSLFETLGIDGDGPIDLTDQAALDAAVARFNDLPFEERGEIMGLGGAMPGLGRRLDDADADEIELPWLPLRAVPTAEDLAALADDVPLLRKVDAFAQALGTKGAKLTKAGNLTVADGRRLVAATGVGDRVDGIRSSTDLPELFAVGQVALHTGAVQFTGDRLQAVDTWTKEPAVARWQRVVDGALQAGVATLRFGAAVPMAPQLAELADQMALHLLSMLWLTDEPVPVEVFVEMMDQAADLEIAPGGPSLLNDDDLRRSVCRSRIGDVVATLTDAAMIVVDGDGDDRVTLTEAAPALAGPTLGQAGFGVLLPGDLAVLDAAELLDTLEGRGGDDFALVAQVWSSGRPPGEGREGGERRAAAAEELVAELLADPGAARVTIGFSVLQELGPDATDAVRPLLDGPLAGHAWLFLADRDAVDYEDAPPSVVARTIVDVFVAASDLGSPADVVEMVLSDVQAEDHAALFDTVATADHPRTGELLDLLGRHHPDTQTAKHARKLALRWRTAHGPTDPG